MKDLYAFTVIQSPISLGDLGPENDGSKWFLYPPSQEPKQFVISPGSSIFIEVRVPDDGPAFVRYYRGEQ